jgi:chromosome segregation ATPase
MDLAGLTEKHSVLLADHAQVEERMGELRRDYGTVVEDRAARSRVVDEHARTISSLQVQMDTRVQEVAAMRQQLEARTQELAGVQQQLEARAQEMADLRRQFDAVEADRTARGKVIEEQGRRTVELESLVHETEQNRDFHRAEGQRLGAELAAREAALGSEIAGLQGKLTEREAHIRAAEARWWHRVGRRLGLM